MKSISEIKTIVRELPSVDHLPSRRDQFKDLDRIIGKVCFLGFAPPEGYSWHHIRSAVGCTPGMYYDATLVAFEQLYVSIVLKLGSERVKESYSNLLEVRKQFKEEGDIENAAKTKYIINGVFGLLATKYDPDLASLIASTGRELIEELKEKLGSVYYDTDRIAFLQSPEEVVQVVDYVLTERGLDIKYATSTVDLDVPANPKRVTIKRKSN